MLSAEELHLAYLTPYLQQATTILESRLREKQRDNGMLIHRITEQRTEIESLIKGLEGLVADLEGSVEAMSIEVDGGLNGLTTEIWEMESEIQAAAR